MYISEAIDQYVGRVCTPLIDYILQDDGDGIYFAFWNVADKPKPNMQDIINISNELAPQIEFANLVNQVNNAELATQSIITQWDNLYWFDCTDGTFNLLRNAKDALINTNGTSISIMDTRANFYTISLNDLSSLLTSISARRLDLHSQNMIILDKIKNNQPYEIMFI
jgi:hypothetical protein